MQLPQGAIADLTTAERRAIDLLTAYDHNRALLSDQRFLDDLAALDKLLIEINRNLRNNGYPGVTEYREFPNVAEAMRICDTVFAAATSVSYNYSQPQPQTVNYSGGSTTYNCLQLILQT